MRITHVITRLIVGGAQENTIASVLGLGQKPGLQVDLIAGPATGPEGSLESEFAEYSGTLTIVPELVRPVHPLKDWLALRRLAALFANRKPDIVHTHSGKAGVLGRLAAARARVPLILHTVHGPSFGPFQGPLANLLFRSAEQYAAAVTNHFVVVADAMKRQYLAAGIGVPEAYSTVRSGFGIEPFLRAENDLALRARFGFSPEHIVVGKIARLFKLKGHDDLFAAAPELVRCCPRLRFLLVGDGPWRERFEAKATALGVRDYFAFAGLVPPAEVPRLLGMTDILVHLSRREGLARALPQALAAGKPVVACACDGAGEVCLDGTTGFLVRPGDGRGLVEAVLRLAESPVLRAQLGENGRQFVRDEFDVNRMVSRLHELYCRLTAGTPVRAPG